MPLPLQYSIQESTLKPTGTTEDYIRLQVSLRAEQIQIVLSDKDYQTLLSEVRQGRLVGLITESGVNIGQFMPSLSGGFPKTKFIAPTKGDFRIAFKVMKQALDDARNGLVFEQIPTVVNNPILTSMTFTISDGTSKTVLNNTIALDAAGILNIIGTNFVKDSMIVEVSQGSNTMRFTELLSSGTKFIEILLNINSLASSTGFRAGQAKLKVWRSNNVDRSSTFSIRLQ